jgi:transcriptional regulator NrdR family protein
MFPDDICPYCLSNKYLNLKTIEWNFRRYHCDKCRKYFAINEYANGVIDLTLFNDNKTLSFQNQQAMLIEIRKGVNKQ